MKKVNILTALFVAIIFVGCDSNSNSFDAEYHKLVEDSEEFLSQFQNRPMYSWTNEAVDSMFSYFTVEEVKYGDVEIAPFQKIDTVSGMVNTDTIWVQYYTGNSQSGKQQFFLAKNHKSDMFCMVADEETDQLLYLYFFKGDSSLVRSVGMNLVWNKYETVTFHTVLRYFSYNYPNYLEEIAERDEMKKTSELYQDSVVMAQKEGMADYIVEYYQKMSENYSRRLDYPNYYNPFYHRTESEHDQYYVNSLMSDFALLKVGNRKVQTGNTLSLHFYKCNEKEEYMEEKVNTTIGFLSNM